MDVKLTIYDEKRQYFSQVVRLPCVVGRGKQCNIAIVHPLVSRQHCEIYEEGGHVKARDLGSLNGTFYRGERLGRGIVIPFGDGFTIGTLNFLVENSEPETTKLFVKPTGDATDILLSSQTNDEEEILDLADFLDEEE